MSERPGGRRTWLRRAAPFAALGAAAVVFVAALAHLTLDLGHRPSTDGARVACHAYVQGRLGHLVQFDASPTVTAEDDYVTVSGTFTNRAADPSHDGEYYCAAHWTGTDGGWSVGTSAIANDLPTEPTVIARHRPSPSAEATTR
ncbi:hypothetical protein ACOACO_07635 [Nocardioides sp. CPCC 205120]|uniref:hypothetical protein n=1 Tax=Nocardioides sp. CPCC 205120 TaxID=3406462 RepID=UPI003B5045F3